MRRKIILWGLPLLVVAVTAAVWQIVAGMPTREELLSRHVRLCLGTGESTRTQVATLVANYRDMWQSAAEEESPLGEYLLGMSELFGAGGAKNESTGVERIRSAAQAGLAEAQFTLARAYATGQGISQDWTSAAIWMREAADQDLPEACLDLGKMYEHGWGVAADFGQAVDLYHAAAELELVAARLRLLDLAAESRIDLDDVLLEWLDALPDQELAPPRYIHAIQALADDESDDAAIARAKDQLQRLASEGYNPARVSFAALQLETAAEADDPRRKDLTAESVRLLTAAAKQDCVDAQLELVASLREGAPGIDADADTAESWRQRAMQCLEKRTQSHDLVAQLLLADLQLDRAEDASTRRRGRENLVELALVGVSAAQFRLGQVLLEGDGVEANPKRGNTYLRLAAEQGHADAQYELAISYRDGRGASANRVEAARWFQQAAEQGHAAALEALADAFAGGEGVPQDEDLASELRELAAEAEPDS